MKMKHITMLNANKIKSQLSFSFLENGYSFSRQKTKSRIPVVACSVKIYSENASDFLL